MRLALVVPDGVGVRNFMLDPFLREAVRSVDLHVLHPMFEGLVNVDCREGFEAYPLLQHRESLSGAVLRHALAYGQMHWAGTRSMRHALNKPVRGSWRRKSLHRLSRGLGYIAASPQGLFMLDRLHALAVRRQATVGGYRRLFEKMKLEVLLCTHQRPPQVVPAVLAAQELGVPTATFIFSWDNLTSKGRIAAPFDHYLVWSELMCQDLLRYYPDVTADRVHVVGTPQFDIYADPNVLLARDEFFQQVGANPKRPLICYSGGDTGTCPEDAGHVRILMDLIRQGEIHGDPQVLVRPAPVDDSGRYAGVATDFPEMILAQPKWVRSHDGWAQIFPTQADVNFLANLTCYADLNVNMASTMTLDFAIHDKPVVNIAFDVASPPPFGVRLWDYFYQFEHYRPVVELGAARFARSSAELAAHINAYLADPTLDREGRRKLVELQVGVPIGQSSRRVVEVLQTIAAG